MFAISKFKESLEDEVESFQTSGFECSEAEYTEFFISPVLPPDEMLMMKEDYTLDEHKIWDRKLAPYTKRNKPLSEFTLALHT